MLYVLLEAYCDEVGKTLTTLSSFCDSSTWEYMQWYAYNYHLVIV